MHRRLLVIDGRVGFAGGVGIADVWTGDAEDPEHWRETHVVVEGRRCATSSVASWRTGPRRPTPCSARPTSRAARRR
ncbi:MAG: hypothetical protein WKG07_46080 [Hymenobacter sp.]